MNNIWEQIYLCWCQSPNKEAQKDMVDRFSADLDIRIKQTEQVKISKNGLFDLEGDEDDDEIE